MGKFLMLCGHTDNAKDENGNPCCAICAPAMEAYLIDPKTVDLVGRFAVCTYCGKQRASSFDLPFFKHCPEQDHDEFYDGCFGWD